MKWLRVFAVVNMFISMPLIAEVTTNIKMPLSRTVFIPCADNGAGESVVLGGYLHLMVTVTENSATRISFSTQSNPENVKGFGQTTGDKYQGNGVTRTHTSTDGVIGYPYTQTFVGNFLIIGQGPSNNFTVHKTIHLTISADGAAIAEITDITAECR